MAPSTKLTSYVLPYLQDLDHSALIWVQPIIIEDDDLIFDGKALSTWYEEERRRQIGVW